MSQLLVQTGYGSTLHVTLIAMSGDLLLPNSENPLIWINPQRVSGAPCFYKTRLPIDSLFDNLEDGVSLDEWLDAYPDITRTQAQAVLELAKQTMLASGK
jgi:uncharacterized protein (DUF433 family)